MNLLFLVNFIALFLFAAIKAQKTTDKCTRQLEEILFIPPNVSKDYLFKLMDQLKAEIVASTISVTDTEALMPIYKSFVQKYGVYISIIPPFGIAAAITSYGVNYVQLNRFPQLLAPPLLNSKGFLSVSNQKIVSDIAFDRFGGSIILAIASFSASSISLPYIQ